MAVIHAAADSQMYHDDPPAYQSRIDVNPTLIVSWWCTLFSLTAILIRVLGRWVRTERLFREDWIMFYSIVPLLIRMALVHVILIWGTNNTTTTGFTSLQIYHHQIGSRLVLAARIFYAAYIWIAKLAVLEFLKRIIGKSWAKSYEVGLRYIHAFLGLTFIAVVVGALSECQPFSHYWQVVPDPGAHCREGLIQLVVMGVCDMVSDVVLIIFPIPLVWQSSMRSSRKVSLICLFLLSTILVAITAYRIPSTIARRSNQQWRSLLASFEILAATFVSNVIVIGSFVRDKGVKKAKFRAASIDDGASLARTNTISRVESVTQHHWGSDEDLVRGVGVALPQTLRRGTYLEQARPAEAMDSADLKNPIKLDTGSRDHQNHPHFQSKWNFAEASRVRKKPSLDTLSSVSSEDIHLRDLKLALDEGPPSHVRRHSDTESEIGKGYTEPDTPSKLNFFDVGNLVDKPVDDYESQVRSRQASVNEASQQQNNKSKAFLSDIGGLLTRPLRIREEDEIFSASSVDEGASKSGLKARKGSPARSPVRSDRRRGTKGSRSELTHMSTVGDESTHEEEKTQAEKQKHKPSGPDEMVLSDIGGLL